MDAFEVLGLPRRPWLDARDIRVAFQELSRNLHPDAVGGDAGRFVALNAAHATLSHPGARLRLLAGGSAPGVEGSLPTGDSDLFMLVGAIVHKARALRTKATAATSALSRALLAADASRICGDVEMGLGQIDAALGAAEERLRAMDEAWPTVSAADLQALATRFDRLMKWRSELADFLPEFRSLFRGGSA
ncbi:MAG TPA: J domain-containing protein [Chthoniobacterales bacterium]